MSDVTRFAPSPTGYLHLGHVHAAFFAATQAGTQGRFLLRIEDIDQTRCRPDYTQALFEDLKWLGLSWETPVRHQSQCLDTYAQALARLQALGVLYRCYCTRADIAQQIQDIHRAPHGPDGLLYPGTCRNLSPHQHAWHQSQGTPYALRLHMAAALDLCPTVLHWMDRDNGPQIADPGQFGDVVLARKDTPTSYHLAVTVDDALQGITLVTRGEDLRAATHVHRVLQHLLDLPVPDYRFHRLLCGPDGKRLAKRDRAQTVRSLREAGLSPVDVCQRAGCFP